jgi:hypothetical protein
MSRPAPKITPAQSNAIASFSRVQAQEKNAKQEFDKRIEKFNNSFAKIEERRARDKALWLRWGHWISRVFFMMSVVLACGITASVIYGLCVGEIKEVNRYSRTAVSLATQPNGYWLSVLYHSGLSAFVWYVSAIMWKGTRWGRN